MNFDLMSLAPEPIGRALRGVDFFMEDGFGVNMGKIADESLGGEFYPPRFDCIYAGIIADSHLFIGELIVSFF